jgi:hypothetical protein
MITLNLKLQPDIEQRLNYLISKKGDIELFFKDFLTYKISQLEKAIFNMEKDLRKYERKYKLTSQEFYQQFEAGKFGDEDDYMVWSGIYELLQENRTELKKIQW